MRVKRGFLGSQLGDFCLEGQKRDDDIDRIRTCAGEPKRFLISLLNHSDTMPFSVRAQRGQIFVNVFMTLEAGELRSMCEVKIEISTANFGSKRLRSTST
jgi:hypothetical protein